MNKLGRTFCGTLGRLLRFRVVSTVVVALLSSGVHAATPLADQPLFTTTGVPGNLALPLSVEFPTAVSVAHIGNYSSSSNYLGYFDSSKCYEYQHVATPTSTNVSHFAPSGAATNHVCSGKWSGNFLNWATMQTIDPFRWAMTGGYRVVDTPSLTILEKAWASGQGGTGNFPNRTLSNTTLITGATPWNKSSFSVRVQGLGNKMRFTVSGGVDNTPTAWDGVSAIVNSTTYDVFVRVKVCDPGAVETNCKLYAAGNYKPEGLIQKYAERMRFSAFGYLNDSSLSRDGGVLRARQKFVGPEIIVPGQPNTPNPAREWDPTTGVFVINPDSADASNTATLFGVPVVNSGVMNYLNKFGQITPGSYKTYDPVGELYYAALRYFKKLGNVPEYTNAGSASLATKTQWVDGFPVITTWDDPIQYSCQKNFILGIGDVNTHADKNVPGPTLTSSEPAKPAAVIADTTVNAVTATNKVGQLQGLAGTLGTTSPYNGCCTNNSALMAGLAYDANTTDIRPDIANISGSIGQTVQTYWLDILEYQNYKSNNQFYLAAKFGGFEVPTGYNPYTNTTPLPLQWWSTSGEMVGSQQRPDNYFTAARPDQMVDGLTRAFARIAAQLRAFTTSFSTSLPQVALAGNASFSAQYDSSDWSGEIVANELAFNATTGDPTQQERWRFTAKLATQAGGTGWNVTTATSGRRIATWNTATSDAVPFRHSSISSAQQSALDTPYRTGDDSADYLNYLRGDRTHEQGSLVTGSSKAYRTRIRLLGDIVGSKANPVGPPSLPLSEAANPGYAAFKLARAGRPTVVYVGANDGMLHAINGALTGADAGVEMFAYVPGALYEGPTATPGTNGLAGLGNPSFSHYFYVNATPTAYDIDFARTPGNSGVPDWRTVLIGGLGKGGRSYYAIDITDPASMTSEGAVADKVLWEFTHDDMGYTFGDPSVIKTRKYGWVVILPSGYNNADGKGYFFIINPRTGELLEKISTGSGTPANDAGLAHLNTYVLDRTDGTADAAYAGDLQGNLWRLDLTATSGAYPAPLLFAVLTDENGGTQPVTTRPMIEVQPNQNKRYVLIGTGRLLETSDIINAQGQNFYAILDGTGFRFNQSTDLPSGVAFPLVRANLTANTNLLTGLTGAPASSMGWYVDLGVSSNGVAWRVLSAPTSFFGVTAFASTLPNGDVCNPSGSSRVYGVNFGSGRTVLDVGAYESLAGVVTDLRFFSVDGKPRLIAGSDQGSLSSIRGNFGTAAGMRRLNWRELPIVD